MGIKGLEFPVGPVFTDERHTGSQGHRQHHRQPLERGMLHRHRKAKERHRCQQHQRRKPGPQPANPQPSSQRARQQHHSHQSRPAETAIGTALEQVHHSGEQSSPQQNADDGLIEFAKEAAPQWLPGNGCERVGTIGRPAFSHLGRRQTHLGPRFQPLCPAGKLQQYLPKRLHGLVPVRSWQKAPRSSAAPWQIDNTPQGQLSRISLVFFSARSPTRSSNFFNRTCISSLPLV